MKKLTNWLFGYLKQSPMLQGALGAIAFIHIGVLGGWGLTWLVHSLPWPKV